SAGSTTDPTGSQGPGGQGAPSPVSSSASLGDGVQGALMTLGAILLLGLAGGPPLIAPARKRRRRGGGSPPARPRGAPSGRRAAPPCCPGCAGPARSPAPRPWAR